MCDLLFFRQLGVFCVVLAIASYTSQTLRNLSNYTMSHYLRVSLDLLRNPRKKKKMENYV